jgi:hypothetical protein
MKLSRFLLVMIFATIVSLVYIQLQVQIYDLAYRGKSKEHQMRKLMDENSHVTYRICLLKSANHLGVKLLTEDSQMCFLDNRNVVQVKTSVPSQEGTMGLASLPKTESGIKFLQNIFSLKSQAEAKPVR